MITDFIIAFFAIFYVLFLCFRKIKGNKNICNQKCQSCPYTGCSFKKLN